MTTQTDHSSHTNAKSAAWDLIGSLFWESGRTTAKPSDEEIGLFLDGVVAGARCTVVGASTKDLVEALIARGAQVTVLDFSERMCADLRAALPAGSCQVLQHDITSPAPEPLRATQDFVLNDRLVNRFGTEEARAGLEGMLDLLADGGQVRASIKLGLYPMDERMIAAGRERGTLAEFYDAQAKVIDFAAAGDVLTDALLPHGDIDPELLLQWYRGRGREKRFDHEDVVALLAEAAVGGRGLRLVSATEFGQAPATRMYTAEAVPCAE
jgi:NAD(P)-dependent dehydrogenase (short-subunit alcohol dehydrogenase family)